QNPRRPLRKHASLARSAETRRSSHPLQRPTHCMDGIPVSPQQKTRDKRNRKPPAILLSCPWCRTLEMSLDQESFEYVLWMRLLICSAQQEKIRHFRIIFLDCCPSYPLAMRYIQEAVSHIKFSSACRAV